MIKIQKKNPQGNWEDFATIHNRGLGEEYRVISDSPASPVPELALLASLSGERGYDAEIIDLLVSLTQRYRKYESHFAAIADDRVGPMMEDIEYDRLQNLSDAERRLLITLAMIGSDACDLIAETID